MDGVLLLLFLIQILIVSAQSPAQLKALRKALADKENTTTTEATVMEPTTRDPRLTGDPRHDWVYDPNLPRELNGYNLSTYPFYTSIPDDITFKCDGRLDGYYASIPHHCQLFHLCAHSLRHDFLCANYTVFDQSQFICHFVNSVNCARSEVYYERNNELYVTTTTELPEYEEEYEEEAPRTKRPARRRKGGRGRRRKARRRTTTTAAPDYYYDDYEEGETLAPEEEAPPEEVAPKPTRTKTTTAAPAPAEEPPAPKPNVHKVRRPQLRPPKPLTQPPTAPPAEEDVQYDYAVEEPAGAEGHPVEEIPQEVARPQHGLSRVPEVTQGSAPVEEEPRRPTAPRHQPRPGARRPVQTEPLHQEAPSSDTVEQPSPRHQSAIAEEAPDSSPAAGTQRRQRVLAGDRPPRNRIAAQEVPSRDVLPEHPVAQAPQRPPRGPSHREEVVASPAEEEGPSIARSQFRGAARPLEDFAGATAAPVRRQEAASQSQRRPLGGSVDEGSVAEEVPQRPVSRRTGPGPKVRQSSTRESHPSLVAPARESHLPSRETEDVVVDAPINDQEPRQSLRRTGSSLPRRRVQRALLSVSDDSYQPFQGTSDLEELEVAASKQISTAILPDQHAVISGILSGVGPIPPPPPPPKNETDNGTESETERPEPPSSDAFVVGSILSGIGAAPSLEIPARGPAADAPRVSRKPKAKKPAASKEEAPAEAEAILTSATSPQQSAITKGAKSTTEAPSSNKGDDKRRVVKRRRKPTTATTTTTAAPPPPPEQEYEYVE